MVNLPIAEFSVVTLFGTYEASDIATYYFIISVTVTMFIVITYVLNLLGVSRTSPGIQLNSRANIYVFTNIGLTSINSVFASNFYTIVITISEAS